MVRCTRWLNRLKYYGENTTIHGINHAANNNISIIERISWLIVSCLSFYGMTLIFLASYDAYDTNPISFVTETAYLKWNTTFPAVTICQVMNQEIYWTARPDAVYSSLQTYISELVFFTGSCYACSRRCDECENVNVTEVIQKYRKPCAQILGKCKWNNIEFNCCDKFLPIDTEYGKCYSINSMHALNSIHVENWMVSNRLTGPGELSIQSLEDVRVFFHAVEDVPFINADADKRDDVMLGEKYIKQFHITEIENDREVRNVPIWKRACRFPDELPPNLKVHKYYSYSTCIVQCHADAQIHFCNCTHHLMPNIPKEQYCGINGLKCLTENYEILNRLHSKGFDKPGLECDCVPSCVEPELRVVLKQNGLMDLKSDIIMRLQALPTQRYKRNVVRSTLDLVVSIGGTAGLFFGASLLSIIETVYLLIIRK